MATMGRTYARFSTDDDSSDVYVRDGENGIDITVATRRLRHAPLPPLTRRPDEEYGSRVLAEWRRERVWLCAERARLRAASAHVRIGGPHDGARWSGLGEREALAVLETLAQEGYAVPPECCPAIAGTPVLTDAPS